MSSQSSPSTPSPQSSPSTLSYLSSPSPLSPQSSPSYLSFRSPSRLLIGLCILLSLVLTSCNGPASDVPHRKLQRSFLTPASSGNPYEVMVVAEDSIWEGYAGKALKRVLNHDVPMLPQPESMFHVSRITPRHFDRITNLFRNIIILKVNPQTTQPKISYERNVWSEPQLVVTIQGPDAAGMSTYITENTRSLIQNISAEELNRTAMLLESDYNINFYRKAKEMFGIEIFIPQDLLKMKAGEDFLWASNDGLSTIQNICVYSYPYVSKKVFTEHAYVALRDTFMRRNIPGEKPTAYMKTNHDYVQCKAISVRGQFVMEARGLWEMHDDMMGGPFVSHSVVDTIHGRVVVAEGFVYAPDKMKRTMIRRLEAALYTMRFVEDKK